MNENSVSSVDTEHNVYVDLFCSCCYASCIHIEPGELYRIAAGNSRVVTPIFPFLVTHDSDVAMKMPSTGVHVATHSLS